MNLEIFNEIFNNVKENKFIQNFIEELTVYLNSVDGRKRKNMETNERLREENCLYQVVDFSEKGVFLQNTRNNEIFEEKIPDNLKKKLQIDSVLRFKSGEYIFEKELTENFLDNMVEINEYRQIQEKFKRETNILQINQNEKFKIISKSQSKSLLKYSNGEIEVPNELLPYFTYSDTLLKYENGKFEKDI